MATTINLTPKGFTGPDAQKNIERANKAMADQSKASADYMNQMEEVISVCGGKAHFIAYLENSMTDEEAKEYFEEIEAIRARKKAADEELLRSVAGAPPFDEYFAAEKKG
jgi:hypothetical protein